VAQPEPPVIASDGLPARPTGQWVHGKKYYLCRYLDIMTRGVGRKWQGNLSYVDLFAGPGRSVIRGTGEEVQGSPVISLGYQFARYVFVDVPEVLSSLKKRLSDHPKSPQIFFVEGDCNNVIDTVREALPADHLTLAFIDPTGLQIKFRTIRRLVHNRKMDLLMTIQFGMGIRMNLPLYVNAEGTNLTAFLGNAKWREDVEVGGSASQVARRILNRYLRELRAMGYGTVRDREIDIRNDQNVLLYFMALASRHPLGGKFWREATQIQWTGQRLLNLQIEE
jgi:three-Cys-motif partner protein